MLAARKQRVMIVLFILLGSATTVGLLLYAFDQGLNVFFTPTEVAEGKVQQGQRFRIGGMVKVGSVYRDEAQGTHIEFVATDTNEEIKVVFDGVLPDLFREGQGVTANGYLDENGVFQATEILAKHDESYMSAEVKAALDAAGHSETTTARGRMQ